MDYSKYFPEIGQEIWHFSHLERAMSLAKDSIKILPETANGRIIWADELTEAKGRFNRVWFAEKGGLWISLSIFDEFLPETATFFPLIFGLVMARCAYDFKIYSAKIKWINDLHINGKKLGGVLIEKFKDWYIVGMGLNVNNILPENLPAISFKELLAKEVSLFKVLEKIIYWTRFYLGFLRFYERKILEEEVVENVIIEDFRKFSDTLGRCVYYSYNLDSEEGIVGKVIDMTQEGGLLLKTENQILTFFSGEVIYIY